MRRLPSLLGTLLAAAAVALSLSFAQRNAAGRKLSPLGPGTTPARRAPEPRRPSQTSARETAGVRAAENPVEIPPRGWFQILKRTAVNFSENQLMSEAASVTFFALLSIFPAIAAMISIYGLFADPSTISAHLDTASGFLPGGGLDIIRSQVERLTQNPSGKLGFGAILGILTAVWSANQGSKAVFNALNDVYNEKEKRGFFLLTSTTLGFTLGALVLIIALLAAVVVLPVVLNLIGLNGSTDLLLRLGRWPAILILLALFLAVLYRIGPSRQAARWRWITWGSVIAAVAWVVLSVGFSWYVSHFGSYNKTYGSLGAAVGFMTWIWLSTTVILTGAQINAEMESQTEADTTTGAPAPMGQRGAAQADSVATGDGRG